MLNAAGAKGLNIIFLYGHNHSNGWDDYLGGSAVYLKKGDKILIAQNDKRAYQEKTLNFTYMNAGYTGYYSNVNGADAALTMSVFQITDHEVTITRYDKNGVHDLKSAGVTNAYKNEAVNGGYAPDPTVYPSSQEVVLSEVTDTTPIGSTQGKNYSRIADVSQLKDGEHYLLIYNGTSFMLPEVVTKANSSGSERTGLNVESTSAFGADTVYGDYTSREWTLTECEGGWLLGSNGKNVKFTNAGSSVNVTLEDTGDVLTIGGSANAFTFAGNGYVLNYNSRGLVNGYASNPAAFYIYTHECNFDQEIVKDATRKSAADCEHAAVYYKSCTCGNVSTTETFSVGEALGHDYSILMKDETNHWYECSRCGDTTEAQAHTPDANGVCTECGYGAVEYQYHRVTDAGDLKDGGHYLMIYNGTSLMLPKVVTKANSSGSTRTGFDLESTTAFAGDAVTGAYTGSEWTLTRSGNGWLLGSNGKSVKFTNTGSSINATLEDVGDVLTIGGSANAFTFEGNGYYLNYNSRGLINGYASNPAAFYIYEREAVSGDKTNLDALITECSALNEEAYTPSSWTPFKEALDAALLVQADAAADQNAVDEAYANLTDGKNQLVLLADKAELKNQIDLADEILENKDDYIPETIEGLEELLNRAKTLYDDRNASQADVNSMIQTLAAANRNARKNQDQKEYLRITDAAQLEDGGEYLLIYNGTSLMLPKVVTKANSSGERTGFDLEAADIFAQRPDSVSGDYEDKAWSLEKTENGWKLKKDGKYVQLTSTTDRAITATLEDAGDEFTISGGEDSFTFFNGIYYLNYNSRGVINGYTSNPAPFGIYGLKTAEVHTHVYDQETVASEALKSPADCEHAAVYYKSCSCGEVSTDDADAFTYGVALGHELVLTPEKAATCTEAGNRAYYTCTRCGGYFEDAAGANKITEPESMVIPAEGHKAVWKWDTDSHWKECEVCSNETEGTKGAHSYGDDHICDECGYTRTVTPPPTDNGGNTGSGGSNNSGSSNSGSNNSGSNSGNSNNSGSNSGSSNNSGSGSTATGTTAAGSTAAAVATGDPAQTVLYAALLLMTAAVVQTSVYGRRKQGRK